MATLDNINNKLNEIKTLYGELVSSFPVGFERQKEQIETILDFATDRISSKYFSTLNQGEMDNIFNALNVMSSEFAHFNSTKNNAYITRSINQITNLKNFLNQIPIENLDKTGVKNLMAELKQAKDYQADYAKKSVDNIEENMKVVSMLIKKADEMDELIAKNLSNSTTIVLSKEFERKRKEENGGELKNYFRGKIKFKKLGTYQRSSFVFVLMLLAIILVLMFGDKFIDIAFNNQVLQESIKNNILLVAMKCLFKLAIISPLIWLAIVQNKKMNLSKKLAEEYWHKEIVAKTFTGMSEQIDKNTEGDTAKTLRIKLLDIMLDTVAKNPADCIDNTDKSDHPINNVLKLSRKQFDNLNKVLDTADKAKKLTT